MKAEEWIPEYVKSGDIDLLKDRITDLSPESLDVRDQLIVFRTLVSLGLCSEALDRWYRPDIVAYDDLVQSFVIAVVETGRTEFLFADENFEAVCGNPYISRTPSQFMGRLLAFLLADGQASEVFERMRATGALGAQVQGDPEYGLHILCQHFGVSDAAATVVKTLNISPKRPPSWFVQGLCRFQPALLPKLIENAAPADPPRLYEDEAFVRSSSLALGRLESAPQDRESGMPPAPRYADARALARHFRGLRKAACDVVAEDSTLTPYLDTLRALKPDGKPITLIVSTGRTGTLSLQKFLQEDPSYEPFHYFKMNVDTPDRNALLYADTLDDAAHKELVCKITRRVLTDRSMEIGYAFGIGRAPVIVSHLDTILAPILLALFPDTRFVRLFREPEKTLTSLVAKNQFQYRQLRFLTPSRDPSTTAAPPVNLTHDASIGIIDECLWYMDVTTKWFRAISETLDPDRAVEVNMAEVFANPAAAADTIRAAFPDCTATAQQIADHFSQRINQKRRPPAEKEIARRMKAAVRDSGLSL
jgi:hypothetical protein